jgi:serine/threonine protein kinase
VPREFEPEQFGPYTLLRHLATGGMGELYLAQREGVAGFAKHLVVKRIRPELATDREFVDMFLTEGRIAALLDHPNVVHISDLGEVNGIFYMAMEYIAGKDLGALLQRVNGPLGLPEALHVMVSVCEGVAFAHGATDTDGRPLQLVHRDINPQNVLVSYQGSVSITDFGIAKARAIPQRETRAGVLKGKFGYLAPEQARSGSVDHRTDIYALGLLLFEITTGQRAIPGRSDTELLYAAAEGVTQRPTALAPSYPPALEQIYLNATANQPEHRYQSARQLQEALVGFQVEHRLVVTSSRLSELMQRMFATEWSEERKALTPTATRASPRGSGLHQPPTVLRSDGSQPKDPSVRQFVNAPTIHDNQLESAFGAEDDLGETVTDLPEYDALRNDLAKEEDLRKTTRITPSGEQALVEDLIKTTTKHTPRPREEVDPILASAQTRLLDTSQAGEQQTYEDGASRAGQQQAPDEGGTSQAGQQQVFDEDERVLRGQWTSEDVAPRRRRARWPIILVSTLVTLCLAGGGVYFFVTRGTGSEGADAAPDSTVVSRTDATDGPSAVVSPLARKDAAPPDAAQPDTGTTPDVGATRADAAHAARDAAAPTPPVAPAHRPRGKGRIRVTCTPPVKVFWRGRALGRTPLTATVTSGRQRLTLRNAKLGIRVGRTVRVKPGGQTVLDTRVGQGVLVVKARPWAHVDLDGKRVGTTPIRPIRLYEGQHQVKLTNTDKNQTQTVRVVIKPGEVTKIVRRFQ